METFPPQFNNPDYRAKEKPEIRMLQARQGDGYQQRTPDGINNVRRRWPGLTWERPEDDARVVYDFLFTHAASGAAFWWTPPDVSMPVKVWCLAVERDFPSYGTTKVSADFEEVFDL